VLPANRHADGRGVSRLTEWGGAMLDEAKRLARPFTPAGPQFALYRNQGPTAGLGGHASAKGEGRRAELGRPNLRRHRRLIERFVA
jgi:hypothetical protein